ncbi:MAG: allantoinase AllB [Myxococcales bacterium]
MTQAWFSRRVVFPDGTRPASLVVEGGRFTEIIEHESPHAHARDVGGLAISPGLVDCHVHLNEPGRTEWEGFETGTKAAAAGGVTTLIDMPLNCLPVTTTRAALELKLAAAAGQCMVDVGFWGGVVPGNQQELAGLRAAGALGCKAFMVHSGIDEFPNASAADLRVALPLLRELGLPLLAHAELDLGADVEPSGHADPRAYHGYLASRPRAWEDAAIALLIELCRETGCRVHVVHLSSASAVPMLRAAKAEGLPISVETCPHYLCLHAESIPDGATHFKCAPPIRERENCEGLWSALFEGVIDFVITDHSPCTPALKLPERGDFQAAWGGIASLQLGLSTVWTEAAARGASLQQLARWMSREPARFAGLSARKGAIAVGHDADFVIWDPEAERTVSAEQLFFKHRLSPYVGKTLRGTIHETWLRGNMVFDGRSHPETPRGELLLHRGDVA